MTRGSVFLPIMQNPFQAFQLTNISELRYKMAPFSPSLLSLPLLFHPSFPLPSSSFLLCSSTNSLPSSAAKSAIDVSYHVFTDERGYPPEVRRAAAERVCMTLLRSCSEVALREFFLEHIGDIMATVEANLSKVEDREIFL